MIKNATPLSALKSMHWLYLLRTCEEHLNFPSRITRLGSFGLPLPFLLFRIKLESLTCFMISGIGVKNKAA